MAEVNIDVAKEASVQAVDTKVGTSSDTASSTPTTLFAGIKGLIAWFTGTWTAARAAKIDTVDTNVDTAVSNTAYSATASSTGTLSQKLAWLISYWTSTRAGYIDNINTYTATSSTASSTGTLSQKLAYVIGLLANATYGLSALKTALTGGGVPIVKSIQRGIISPPASTVSSISVGISSVTASKCMVILNTSHNYDDARPTAVLSSLSSTTLTVTSSYSWTSNNILAISWQVIEFY